MRRDDVIELITNIMKIGKQENSSKQNKTKQVNVRQDKTKPNTS